MKRGVLAVAVTLGLVLGVAWPTSALGLTQVTLSCDDGTSTVLLVDSDTLLGLTQGVQAMIDYPAGLTCAIAQVRATTREWFATARNYALYANQGGAYDDVLKYLKM